MFPSLKMQRACTAAARVACQNTGGFLLLPPLRITSCTHIPHRSGLRPVVSLHLRSMSRSPFAYLFDDDEVEQVSVPERLDQADGAAEAELAQTKAVSGPAKTLETAAIGMETTPIAEDDHHDTSDVGAGNLAAARVEPDAQECAPADAGLAHAHVHSEAEAQDPAGSEDDQSQLDRAGDVGLTSTVEAAVEGQESAAMHAQASGRSGELEEDAVPLGGQPSLQDVVAGLLTRMGDGVRWPSTVFPLTVAQGSQATVTYTADAGVAHAWLLWHVLTPGVSLLGLDAEWSTDKPSLEVLQLSTASGVLVFHCTPAAARPVSSAVHNSAPDEWLASTVVEGFNRWVETPVGSAVPQLALDDELAGALESTFGQAEVGRGGQAVQVQWGLVCKPTPTCAAQGVPSGLLAMMQAMGGDAAEVQGATSPAALAAAVLDRPRVAGVGVATDAALVAAAWGCAVPALVDVAAAAQGVGSGSSLAAVAREMQGSRTWKSRAVHRVRRWGTGPLSAKLLKYAAMDALMSRLAMDGVIRHAAAVEAPAAVPSGPHHGPWSSSETAKQLRGSFSYLSVPALLGGVSLNAR